MFIITSLNTLADADIVVRGKDGFMLPGDRNMRSFLYPDEVDPVLLLHKDDI